MMNTQATVVTNIERDPTLKVCGMAGSGAATPQ
jgi:hypothetical protein